MKVLLIDDDEDIRTVGRLSLEAVGKFQTAIAASAREGIRAASVDRPDLILMDMMMPEMDGLTALREIQQTAGLEDVPVVFMTARVQRSDVDRYAALGAAGMIRKPFNPMTLPDEIRAIMDRTPSP
jgi:CheY-like chemotaxis protein